MSFVLFLRGMIAVLVVFAIAIYFLTGSIWTATWQTLACAVLIQVGYFVGVLFMVWRSGGEASQRAASSGEAEKSLGRPEEGSVDAGGKLPAAPFPNRH